MNIDDAMQEKPRWIYRFDNYKRAITLLRESMDTIKERELNQLEKEGVIQRFEYSWELAWKTLKDYLHAEGVVLDKITPASVIRAGFEAKIINNGELWMQALDARNKMAHSYDLKVFEQIILKIEQEYFTLLDDLYHYLLNIVIENEYQS